MYDARCEVYSELSPRPLDTVRVSDSPGCLVCARVLIVAPQFYQQLDTLPLIRLSYRGADHYDSVSHVDSPLPLTIERDLVRVPLGSNLTQVSLPSPAPCDKLTSRQQHVVLTARIEQLRKSQAHDKVSHVEQRTETVYCKVMGCVQLGSEGLQRLRNLCDELQLEAKGMFASRR